MSARGTRNTRRVVSAGASTEGEDRRAIDRSERLMEDPYAPVEVAMSEPPVTTTPNVLLSEIMGQFERFTGLPVVDDKGQCVGILSDADILRYQKQQSTKSTAELRVRDVMTSPAIVIARHAPVAYAAGLMLKHKVHRLPVVDDSNVVVGVLTRTDIYQPLLPAVNPMLHRLVGFNPEDYPNF